MSSAAKLAANQSNGQHSTGPRTPEGIAACRFNATKHGLSGQQIVIKGEDPAEYEKLRASYQAHFRAGNEQEAMLVEQVAQNHWRLQRAYSVEAKITAELGETAIFTDPIAMKKYANFMRHRNSVERAFKWALKELERLQLERRKQEVPLRHLEESRRYFVERLESSEAKRDPNNPQFAAMRRALSRPPYSDLPPLENGSVL